MFDNLDLEGCIKFYAQFIADDIHEGRVAIHRRICELLGVTKEEFSPFQYDFGGECIGNVKRAEWSIRRAISKLKNEKDTGN